MKPLLIALSVILIICGLLLVLIAPGMKESLQPNQITMGYVDGNGNFHKTDSGYIGGNSEGVKTMEMLETFGWFSLVGGGILLVGSLLFGREKSNSYYE